MSEREFGQLLSVGIRHISVRENKQLQIIEDELGYAVKRSGCTAIRYWRQGHWPSKPADVETLARAIVQRGRVDRTWLERFLRSANYPNLAGLCDELYANHHPQHLPSPPTGLIGRDREVADIVKHFRSNHVRLLTLTGAPGVGKTRLALHLAEELSQTFGDGVVFAPLASIRDPELVLLAIAGAVGLMEGDGPSLKARLVSFLQERELLLVLDNFEQVIAAAPHVAELLSAAPHLKILVTSREPLHIDGEYENPVLPLALAEPDQPARLEIIARVPAVQLFVERAQAANPNFQLKAENAQVVVDICARLDGLPLAIELVAARSKWLTPQQMLEQLGDRFALLMNGPRDLPARQQSLQAAIDWSYELLTEPEKQILCRLSVFRGGCTADALLVVCVSGGLEPEHLSAGAASHLVERLIDKGLVQRMRPSVSAENRCTMLETIQEYASHKLFESGEADEVQQRHRDWCLALAEQAKPNLRGPDQLLWLNRLEQEINNFRKALSWYVEHPAEVEFGLRLAVALGWFWHLHSRHREGCNWLDRLLAIELPADASRSTRRFQALAMCAASVLQVYQQNLIRAMELARASLDLFSEIGDSPGVVFAKMGLSYITCLNGDTSESVALVEEVLPLCRATGDRFSEAQLLDAVLGEVAFRQGDYTRAAAWHEQSLALRRALHDADGIAWSLFLLARNLHALGDATRAQQLYEESRVLWRQLGNRRWSVEVLHKLGELVYRQGDYAQAKALFEECLTTAHSLGDQYLATRALDDLEMVAREAGKHPQALVYFQKSTASALVQSVGYVQ
jgi:predicted ATPase